jgi:hypothetical protein
MEITNISMAVLPLKSHMVMQKTEEMTQNVLDLEQLQISMESHYLLKLTPVMHQTKKQ